MTKSKEVTNESNVGVVLYVDGGCRGGYPNDISSQYGGWGMHGYTYNIGVTPPKPRTKKDIPTVDGYQEGSKVPLKDQVVPTAYIDGYGSISDKDNSALAELNGFKQAIKFIKANGYKNIHLKMDNQYVIQGVNDHYAKWEKANWKKSDGKPISNKELWIDVMDMYRPLSEKANIKVSWVNGHSGDLGNDRADYLATKGVYLGRNGVKGVYTIKTSPISKYRDPKVIINPLFTKSRWYFNTVQRDPQISEDGRYVYHLGSHGTDDSLIGKPMADSTAVVLYLKEKDSVLESVRQRHMQIIDNPMNDLCMARLDTLLTPRIYDEIERDGVNVLSMAPRKLGFVGLCSIDNQCITKVIRPSGLTFKLIDTHNFLETKLDSYIKRENTGMDITSYFYDVDVNAKKEKFKCKLVPGTIKVIVKDTDLIDGTKADTTLTIGIDSPPIELFKAVAGCEPTVSLLTWMLSPVAYRYGLVVEAGDDVMIWMGKDSSINIKLK